MHAGLLDFMHVSIALLAIGFAMLLLMVQFELGPLGKLSPGGRWLMALALGSGMVAFSIKLMVIAVLTYAPEQTIGALIAVRKSPSLVEWERRNSAPPVVRDGAVQKPYSYVWRALPDVAPAPPWNPTTPEKVALGQRLFHDPALSGNRKISCSSCHDVRKGAGEDHRSTSLGIGGQVGSRNAPTVWNAAFQSALFWDGRAASLEEQAKGPPVNPREMGMPSLAAVAERIRSDKSYREPFAKAFGADKPITIDRIVAAIAAYERTLITPDSPYDRFVRGDENALSPTQLRGMALFQSVGCIYCHSGPNFSGASLFDAKPAALRLFPVFTSSTYVARYRLTKDVGVNAPGSKQGVWRIPSLRNVELTAPYFHNGSVDNLPEAVRIMATVQRGRTITNSLQGDTIVWSKQERTISSIKTSSLSDRDVDDIVAFLKSLTSDALAARCMCRKF